MFEYNNPGQGRAICFSKLTWQNQEEANAAIAYSGFQYGSDSTKSTSYRCNYCKKWHIAKVISDDE